MESGLPQNAIGPVFWIIAVAALLAAIGSVALKKKNNALAATIVTTFSVGAILVYLGYYSIAVLYLILVGGTSVLFLKLYRPGASSADIADKFKRNPRPILNIFLSVLIFTGILFIISRTNVWQYETTPVKISFSEMLAPFVENYLLLSILTVTFILITAILFLVSIKKGEA